MNSTIDLNLTSREELDLLTKWLGPQSAEQAKRICAVHIHWCQLGTPDGVDECYGSAEMIENALLEKLEEFPKITNKDNQKLWELEDLLLDQEAALKDGFLPGLSHLYTRRGFNVLPNGLSSFLSPCASVIHIKEKLDKKTSSQHAQSSREPNLPEDNNDYLGVSLKGPKMMRK